MMKSVSIYKVDQDIGNVWLGNLIFFWAASVIRPHLRQGVAGGRPPSVNAMLLLPTAPIRPSLLVAASKNCTVSYFFFSILLLGHLVAQNRLFVPERENLKPALSSI